MRTRRLVDRLCLAGLAAAGVVAGHSLGYAAAAPDGHHRQELLAESGHGAWEFVIPCALALLVAGLARFACRRVWDARSSEANGPLFFGTAKRLVLVQSLGFIGLEAAERAFSGEGALAIVHERPVAFGLLAQLLLSVVGAAFLVLFRRAIELVRASLRPAERSKARPPSQRPAPHVWIRLPTELCTSISSRGPPGGLLPQPV